MAAEALRSVPTSGFAIDVGQLTRSTTRSTPPHRTLAPADAVRRRRLSSTRSTRRRRRLPGRRRQTAAASKTMVDAAREWRGAALGRRHRARSPVEQGRARHRLALPGQGDRQDRPGAEALRAGVAPLSGAGGFAKKLGVGRPRWPRSDVIDCATLGVLASLAGGTAAALAFARAYEADAAALREDRRRRAGDDDAVSGPLLAGQRARRVGRTMTQASTPGDGAAGHRAARGPHRALWRLGVRSPRHGRGGCATRRT